MFAKSMRLSAKREVQKERKRDEQFARLRRAQSCSRWECACKAGRFFSDQVNPLTPKITDFLTHFCPLLPKRKKEYIMTKPCILNIFKIWNFFLHFHHGWEGIGFILILFFQMDKAYSSIPNYGQRWTK